LSEYKWAGLRFGDVGRDLPGVPNMSKGLLIWLIDRLYEMIHLGSGKIVH